MNTRPTNEDLSRMYDIIQADAKLSQKIKGLGFGDNGEAYRRAAIKLHIMSLAKLLKDGKRIRNRIVHEPDYVPSEPDIDRVLRQYAEANSKLDEKASIKQIKQAAVFNDDKTVTFERGDTPDRVMKQYRSAFPNKFITKALFLAANPSIDPTKFIAGKKYKLPTPTTVQPQTARQKIQDKNAIALSRGSVENYEGFRSDPYPDSVGKMTIGHGLTEIPDSNGVWHPVTESTKSISEEQSRKIINTKLQKIHQYAKNNYLWYANANPWIKATALDLMYNKGEGVFSEHKSPNFNDKLRRMPIKPALFSELTTYNTTEKGKLEGLKNRNLDLLRERQLKPDAKRNYEKAVRDYTSYLRNEVPGRYIDGEADPSGWYADYMTVSNRPDIMKLNPEMN